MSDLRPGFAMLRDVIDRHPLVLSPDASVAQAVELMKQRASCVLAKTDQELAGILTERDVVKLTAQGILLSEMPLADVMTRNLITMQVNELQNPFEVLKLFQQHRIRHLPIVDEQNNLIGLLTPQALRKTLQSADLLRLRRVADVMTAPVITAPPAVKVIALAQLMANHRVSCVVIAEAQPPGAVGAVGASRTVGSFGTTESSGAESREVPLGIVTERDIVNFQSLKLDLSNLTAEQVMSAPLSCVSPEDTLWESHQVMNRLQVRRLVVAQDGWLAGIITQTSLLSALDPVDLCHTIQVLQSELDRLRDEKLQSLEARSSNLTERVQETENRFQAIFNNMFQFTGLMNPDGTVVDVNQTALDLGGLSLEQVVGRPAWETYWWTISPETQAQFRQAIARAAQGEFVRYEVDIRGIDGKPLSIDFSIRPLWDAQGNVTLLIPEGRDISDRKQAELELRASEQRYASLAKAAPVGIFRTDADGKCLYVNERWSWIAGLSSEEAQGEGWVQGLHPEDRASVAREWYQSTQEKRPFSLEYRFQRPDGQTSWVLGQSVAEYDALGQLIGYVGTITDVTERVQSQRKLQDSEERLRLALAVAKQGFYDLNLQTNEIIVNDDFARMLDYDPETHLETSTSWIDRLHPEGAEEVIQIFEACVQGDMPDYSLEMRQRTGQGNWKWILCQGKVVEWDETGNPIRMMGIQTDIDAIKQAEQLKSELLVLEDILEATLAGYWDWDLQNNQEYLSPTFKQMLGYEEHELGNAPKSWKRLIFAEDLARIKANFEQHLQSQGEVPFYNEVRYRHKNGSVIWVICAGRVIDWDETGKALRMVGCHVDITQRKRAEEQLRSLNQELQRSNKDLEQFAYITSHDLQEPLRAVTAYTNLLLEEYGDVLADENAQKYTGYLLDGTQRMRELIRDLLAYSRVGSNDLKLIAVDCHELLANVQLNLQDAISQSQAEIRIGPMPVIEGDRTQLLQLFQNLLSNAIKFNQGDSPKIQISAIQQSTPEPHQQPYNLALRQQPHWLFSVQDQGIGIRDKYLVRIFEIFRRLHIREQFPGTGIGLSICQRVIERHRGDIWAESKLGEGTTFYFTFPIHEPQKTVEKSDGI